MGHWECNVTAFEFQPNRTEDSETCEHISSGKDSPNKRKYI